MSPPPSVDFLRVAESEGPQAAYRALVRSGELIADPSQALAAEKLQGLSRALHHYKPGNGEGGWRARLGLISPLSPSSGPRRKPIADLPCERSHSMHKDSLHDLQDKWDRASEWYDLATAALGSVRLHEPG